MCRYTHSRTHSLTPSQRIFPLRHYCAVSRMKKLRLRLNVLALQLRGYNCTHTYAPAWSSYLSRSQFSHPRKCHTLHVPRYRYVSLFPIGWFHQWVSVHCRLPCVSTPCLSRNEGHAPRGPPMPNYLKACPQSTPVSETGDFAAVSGDYR